MFNLYRVILYNDICWCTRLENKIMVLELIIVVLYRTTCSSVDLPELEIFSGIQNVLVYNSDFILWIIVGGRINSKLGLEVCKALIDHHKLVNVGETNSFRLGHFML